MKTLSDKWDNITKKDIIKAIDEFDKNPEKYDKYKSRSTFLIYKGKEYPAKHIRRIAYVQKYNESPDDGIFSGGKQTKDFLEKLGFEIRY